MEVDEFDFSVKMFHQRGAAFHPVAAVQIVNVVNFLDLRAMNVTANYAVRLMAARHRGQSIFVFSDELHGGLGLEFQIRRERPVTKTQRAPQPVEPKIKVENPVVKMRAELFEQVIEVREAVRLMAVDDEIFFSVGGGVHHLARDGDAAESHPKKLLDEFVVVAGNVNHLGLLAAFAEQFLDEHVVVIAPKPAELQFPPVNEIADEVEIFAVHDAEKFQQRVHLRVPRAEVNVGNPNGAVLLGSALGGE